MQSLGVPRMCSPVSWAVQEGSEAVVKKALLTGVAVLFLATGAAHTARADEGEFPEDFQKLWCIEFSKSTTNKIFLVDCFADDAAVLLVSRTLYTAGPLELPRWQMVCG
jgi:hypothetical protein